MSSKFSLTKKETKEYKLSEENALAAVVDLLGYYDIDIDKLPANETGDQVKNALETALEQLVELVKLGEVEIDRDDQNKIRVTQHIAGAAPLVYGEVGARAKLAMDKCPKGETHSRIYALAASLTNLPQAAITKMSVKDLRTLELLGMVFSNA